jgi:hypothetical protein
VAHRDRPAVQCCGLLQGGVCDGVGGGLDSNLKACNMPDCMPNSSAGFCHVCHTVHMLPSPLPSTHTCTAALLPLHCSMSADVWPKLLLPSVCMCANMHVCRCAVVEVVRRSTAVRRAPQRHGLTTTACCARGHSSSSLPAGTVRLCTHTM